MSSPAPDETMEALAAKLTDYPQSTKAEQASHPPALPPLQGRAPLALTPSRTPAGSVARHEALSLRAGAAGRQRPGAGANMAEE